MRLLIFVSIIGVAVATDSAGQSAGIEQAVKDKKFTINVESMSPRRGGFRRLTTLYTFVVTPDTVMTELPYVGRAYQATMGTNGGVKFLSRDYEYVAKPRKKGAWDVTLKPRDVPNYPVVNLTIQPNGTASIRMTPVDREYISYTGTVRQP